MKITVGSPNPPSAWSIVSTPVAQKTRNAERDDADG